MMELAIRAIRRGKMRDLIYQKYGGRCAYTGSPLKSDWQVDHVVPKRLGGTDDIDNLMPAQRIINHYKRALSLDDFRSLWLADLHKRLKRLPKKPRVERSVRRKAYLLEVADLFGITPEQPFSGRFYFEEVDRR